MRGAAKAFEHRRSDVWFTAMLPHFEEPIPHKQFVEGRSDNSAQIAKCLAVWDKVDAALAANNNRKLKGA